MPSAPSRSDIDIYTEEAIVSPYENYRALRNLGPVVWLEQYQAWAMARYQDVYAALHNHETFSSGAGVALNDPINEVRVGQATLSATFAHTFAEVPAGQCLVLADSAGHLAVAVNGGSAARELTAEHGHTAHITVDDTTHQQ